MGIVKAVCVSEQRGTAKRNVGACRLIENWGLENDAHAGKWHRQVSLLGYGAVEAFRARGAVVGDGVFGENLLVDGIDFRALPAGAVLRCGEAVLELTQIGKECHSECEIRRQVGDCVMPREGAFAAVLRGGTVRVGDEMTVVPPNGYTAAVITASDRASRGEREDLSGPAAAACLKGWGYAVKGVSVLPDDAEALYLEMVRLVDAEKVDAVFTTGGTGFSPRDNTPEATLRAATRQAPGIAQAMLFNSLQITPRAMLSRAVSVMRGQSLIVNLPGSPKAVRECLDYLLPTLSHGMGIMTGREGECGSDH